MWYEYFSKHSNGDNNYYIIYLNLPPQKKKSSYSLCFKLGQPQRVILGLREILLENDIVQRINKARIRQEEQSEKAESCRKNLWNEIQLKGQ